VLRVNPPKFGLALTTLRFGDPFTEFPPTGDPELDAFDAVERPACCCCCPGIGICEEDETEGGKPCAVAGGVNKWPAPFALLLFPLELG